MDQKWVDQPDGHCVPISVVSASDQKPRSPSCRKLVIRLAWTRSQATALKRMFVDCDWRIGNINALRRRAPPSEPPSP